MVYRGRKRKILVLFVCICFAVTSFFMLTVLAVHADHDCVGEHCEICLCLNDLHQQWGTLKGIIGSGILPIVLPPGVTVLLGLVFAEIINRTPISMCTRLNQ